MEVYFLISVTLNPSNLVGMAGSSALYLNISGNKGFAPNVGFSPFGAFH